MKRLQTIVAASAVGLLLAASALPAHAADRVYLRNGSDFICDHQKNLNGQVRLYLTSSDNSYLDVPADQIVRQETVPAVAVKTPAFAGPALASAPPTAAQLAVPTPAQLAALLDRAGAEHHLDPDLLASVVRAESGGHISAVSRTGARGLMQLMPSTAKDLGVADSFVPAENVAGGTTYLDALLMYYHDNLALALAAYNAGPAAVNRYGGIPPYAETRRYVERVIHDYNRRKLEEARLRDSQQHHARLSSQAGIATIIARP